MGILFWPRSCLFIPMLYPNSQVWFPVTIPVWVLIIHSVKVPSAPLSPNEIHVQFLHALNYRRSIDTPNNIDFVWVPLVDVMLALYSAVQSARILWKLIQRLFKTQTNGFRWNYRLLHNEKRWLFFKKSSSRSLFKIPGWNITHQVRSLGIALIRVPG